MPSEVWGEELARAYDATYAQLARPEVVDPMVDVLAELAEGGRALEFACGTGRPSLALSARGVSVAGIELSPAMAQQMRSKPGAADVPVTIGDMASTVVDGVFSLVYVVANSLMNLTTQDEQVAVFANAARHLGPGCAFVVELIVPQVNAVPPGSTGRVFRLEPGHVGIETYDDTVAQIAWSHHWVTVDGLLVQHSAPYRYVWPSELVLMGRLSGLQLVDRWAGWRHEPFTAESTSQVAVFRKPVA